MTVRLAPDTRAEHRQRCRCRVEHGSLGVAGQRPHHPGRCSGDRRRLRGLGGHDRRRRGVGMSSPSNRPMRPLPAQQRRRELAELRRLGGAARGSSRIVRIGSRSKSKCRQARHHQMATSATLGGIVRRYGSIMTLAADRDLGNQEFAIEDITTGVHASGFGQVGDGRSFSFHIEKQMLVVEVYRPRICAGRSRRPRTSWPLPAASSPTSISPTSAAWPRQYATRWPPRSRCHAQRANSCPTVRSSA